MINRQALPEANKLRKDHRASVAPCPTGARKQHKRIQSCNKSTCTEKTCMVFCLLNYNFTNKNYSEKTSIFRDLSCSSDNVLYITQPRKALLFLHQICLASARLSRSFLLFLSPFRMGWDSYPLKNRICQKRSYLTAEAICVANVRQDTLRGKMAHSAIYKAVRGIDYWLWGRFSGIRERGRT